MTAHSPRAGLGAVTAVGLDGPAATPCCVAPGRATPSAGLLPTAAPPYTGRSAQLRVLDLFSGIGGFSLGLERTGGFRTVQFCEIDPFCRRVLTKHWPGVPCHDDVTTMQFREGMADVITGGFPCQDISYAGRGAGLAGERSGLYRHLVEAVRVVRPRYAIVENVAALLGRGLDVVLGDLAEVGYDAEVHCIPASAVGAPHHRDRLWIIAHSHEIGWESRGCSLKREDVVHDKRQWSAAPFNGWRDVVGWLKSPDADAIWQTAVAASRRMDDGVSRGLDDTAIGALGNSIVPQIATLIGQAILTADSAHAETA